MKQNVIRVVKVAPNQLPEVIEIENTLEAKQKLVGGYIEVLPIEDKVCIVCNEEGKINRLPLNRALRDEDNEIWEVIAGTFFIAGDDYENGEFVSLTDEQANFYKDKFHYPEFFYMMGNKIHAKRVPIDFMEGF